ncbi:chloramphenicol 3-O phosphotransferase [Actinacidiphila yanglinensis]|uniref:Chloramphenicol 3-O phosphotransferase n=1 Tax=Actinacidiphila yanglinensis TaxID=310779 RepID=A0A1H6DYH4_9ACTN|nr:chloramphenicol phosphotransferase CPT [Actinacidiphila yanglinensis]SEG90199.1 chloramphenicol 3-O phosphotransferase [Actinacidiphila yanglinensis]
MPTQVIILNGGSSSGKSSLARALQDALPGPPWLTFGTDTLVEALPARMRGGDAGDGIAFGPDGEVVPGADFRRLDDAWALGMAAAARAGAHLVIDEVFLGGAASQTRWRDALSGMDVLWVGVRCDPEVAAAREAARGDRTPGMAARQAALVHEGVSYDLEVDTSRSDPASCARTIAARVTGD